MCLSVAILVVLPKASLAADYSPGEACSTSGAFHQINDSSGMDFLICDGSMWLSTLYFGSAGGLTISKLSGQPAPQYSSASDTLSALSCSSGEVAQWNGSAWVCAVASGGTPGGSDTQIQFNDGGQLWR